MENTEIIPDTDTTFTTRIDLQELRDSMQQIRTEIGHVIIGQHRMVEELLIAILADGHVLIEGVPGVAKTLTSKLIAKTLSVDFARVQFTPDLMPSDVLGTSVYNPKEADFDFKAGPVFSNIVLIDEINRAPAKTQSALFELMEERQVTVDGTTYPMSEPFIVLATQNPVEQEGTYRLPEAQLDRFLFKIEVGYPSKEEEGALLSRIHQRKHSNPVDAVSAVLSAEQLIAYRQLVHQVHIDEKLINYIAAIVNETRTHQALYLGASPRASIAIMQSAKALAALQGRDFVTPEDIKEVAQPVLRHRIILTPEKEMEGIRPQEVIQQLIDKIEVPR
jgi:MoxR-like ATPase